MNLTDDAPDKDRNHQKGHRERLRQRFLQGGADAMPDYELLELLLFLSIPQKDVKPLARDLLARFGSFAGVIAASPQHLMEVEGVKLATASALKIIEAAAGRMAKDEIIGRPVFSSWDKVVKFCRVNLAHKSIERFYLLFLDNRNQLIAAELQQEGTVNHTPLYPREVVKRALELNALSVIMVHNHPSGDPKPSRADIDMTAQVRDGLKAVGISLHDHLIIARKGYNSFKSMGVL